MLSIINAFRSVMNSFVFTEPLTFSEDFAQKRFHKKYEQPDSSNEKSRAEKCWEDWLAYDQAISLFTSPSGFPELYRARLTPVRRCKFDTWDLPKGSEFCPTKGLNSIESRLSRSVWTCTKDNFEQFAIFVYNHKAMKTAFRRRYQRWYRKKNFDISQQQADKFLFSRFSKTSSKPDWECFLWKLEKIVRFVHGSRFSRVPKNNLVDRPINIEAFGNMIVQRQIGNHLRKELKRLFDIDLDTLAATHREKISDARYATIDLKNASDSISLSFVEWFLPPKLFKQISACRSDFIYGKDKQYHKLNKVSSMGNGFTFELMTLILTAVARQLDESASVFGDDIIILNEHAPRLIEIIERIGFVVNKEKSFVNSAFRESCGGNYHDNEGYIESFDFHYPENIHDCVVLYNKTLHLATCYASFEKLRAQLRRHIPTALQGSILPDLKHQLRLERAELEREGKWGDIDSPSLSNWFQTGLPKGRPEIQLEGFLLKKPFYDEVINKIEKNYQIEKRTIKCFVGYSYSDTLKSPTLRKMSSRHWAKYLMYLYSNCVTKDPIVGEGSWTPVLYVSFADTTVRWQSIEGHMI